MKNLAGIFFAVVLLVFASATAQASSFIPGDPDLDDLNHSYYYTWGIDWQVPGNEHITGASLFLDDIRNYNSSNNDLWVHLLASAPVGVAKTWDNQGGGDAFSGQGILLEHWQNLPATAQDIVYDFDTGELAALITYLADGNIGLGFDPDCHFYNNGVELRIETSTAPLPAAVWLLGTGLVSLAGIRRYTRG